MNQDRKLQYKKKTIRDAFVLSERHPYLAVGRNLDKNILDADVVHTIQMNLGIYHARKISILDDGLKRFFDVAMSLTLLLLLFPVFVLIAFAVKISSPGPILFKQLRIGDHFKPFFIYKFRTMHMNMSSDMIQNLPPLERLERDPRVTRVGSFFRKWSLDELPQLLNVLMGEMSLVGPRPLSVDDSLAIPANYILRYAAKPGMTGLWQTTVRNTNNGLLKVRLDCLYVRKRSFWFDLILLFQTVPSLVKSGIGAGNNYEDEDLIAMLDENEQEHSYISKDDNVEQVSFDEVG